MKKTKISIVLCVLLLAVLTLIPVFATAGSAEIAASVSMAEPGETVEFVVSLSEFWDTDTMRISFTVPDSLTVQSGEWLISGEIANYNAAKKQGVWTKTSGVDLSAKTEVFKLVCVMGEPAVGQQELASQLQVNVGVKPTGGRELTYVDDTASVTVSKPATELNLDQQTLQLDLSAGITAQLTATVNPENTTEKLSWSSGDNGVVTVSNTGLVTAVAEGEATVTATVGTLQKTCLVTVSCGHANKSEHIASESTCMVQGNNLYYICDTCGDAFKADGTTATTVDAEKLPLADHTGGTATCAQQALCQWCSQPYGTTLPHNFSEKLENEDHLVAGSGADCQHAKQYYYDCVDCTAISTDKTFDSINFGYHQISADWSNENETHFRKCTVTGCSYKEQEGDCAGGTATCKALATCATCGNPYGQLAQCRLTAMNPTEKHLYLPATCTQQAQYYYSCEMCDASGTETFFYGSLADHDFTEKLEDDAHFVVGSGADCQQAKRYYYDCANCTAISADKTFDSATYGSHQVSDQWTTENEKHFHKCTVSGCTYIEDEDSCAGGTATCTAKAVCAECQTEYGTTLPHDFSQRIEDPDHFVAGSGADCQHAKQYYYDCADCNAISTDKTFDSAVYGDHQVSNLWTSENDTHFYRCTVTGCSYKEQEDACAGGTATCKALATCATCDNPYGQLVQCRFTIMNPVEKHQYLPATCTQQAQYYYSCEMCDASGTETFFYGNLADHKFTEKLEDSAHFVAGSGIDCQHAKQYYFDCADCTAISTDKTFDSATYGSHQVSDQWTTENGKHFHKCTVAGCTYKEDETPCAGGTATCTVKAVCAECRTEYGTTLPHDFSQRIEDPAHFVAGSGADCQHAKQYYYDCADCTAISTDKTFDTAVYGNHKVSTDWTSENNTHFHKCTVTGCSYKEQEGACAGGTATCKVLANCATCNKPYGQLVQCSFTVMNPVDKYLCAPATCTQKAQYYYGCVMCGASGTQTFTTVVDSNNHVHTEIRGQLAANCYKDGYTGDTWCLDCTQMIKKGETIKATGNHTAGTVWNTDENSHWYACTTQGCTAQVSKAEHSYQWKVDTAATEDSTGIKHEECVCGVKCSEGTVIEKLDHVHISITHHAAVKATCVSAGAVEYWTCSSAKCAGKCYSDEACQIQISEIAEPIDAQNHTELFVTDAVAATCDKTGYSGDTWCAGCETLVIKGETTLATGKHTGIGEYKSDQQYHWKVCACGEYTNKADHTITLVNVKEATQTEPGYTGDEICSVCGYIAKAGEQTPVLEVPATEPEATDETEPEATEKTEPTTGEDTQKDGQKTWIIPVVILSIAAVGSGAILVVSKKRKK